MPETIEAEVIEIDGASPPNPAESEARFDGQAGRRMVLQFDRRWWPLWVLLGVVAVVLVATVGVLLGALYLLFAIIRGFFRILFGGLSVGGTRSGAIKRSF